MNLYKFTHANNNQVLYVAANQVAGFYYSPHHKSTMIVATGGAVLPVTETVEQVQSVLTSNPQQKEKENEPK